MKSKAWIAMATVEGMKFNGFARWNHPLRSPHQHLKSNIRSCSQAKKLSGPVSNKIREEKLKKSEESLRTVMYLSCWGPYN